MILTNWSNDPYPSIDHISGIPPATHSNLYNAKVNRVIGKSGIGHDREHLEEGQARSLPGDILLIYQADNVSHILIGGNEAFLRDGLTVERDALADCMQVRAGESSGPQTSSLGQRIDHARGRGLPVGTRYVHCREGLLRVAQVLHCHSYPVKGRLHLVLGSARNNLGVDPADLLVEGGLTGCFF